jgi:hypothetical protein
MLRAWTAEIERQHQDRKAVAAPTQTAEVRTRRVYDVPYAPVAGRFR